MEKEGRATCRCGGVRFKYTSWYTSNDNMLVRIIYRTIPRCITPLRLSMVYNILWSRGRCCFAFGKFQFSVGLLYLAARSKSDRNVEPGTLESLASASSSKPSLRPSIITWSWLLTIILPMDRPLTYGGSFWTISLLVWSFSRLVVRVGQRPCLLR